MAGPVLAAGPADVSYKVAPVPVDEPVLAEFHDCAGGRVGASHGQAATPLHVARPTISPLDEPRETVIQEHCLPATDGRDGGDTALVQDHAS